MSTPASLIGGRNRPRHGHALLGGNELLTVVAHDLRSPLAAIISAAEVATAMEPVNGRQLRLLLRDIATEAQESLEVLDEILLLERARAGQTTLTAKPFRVCDLCRQVRAHFAAAARRKEIALVDTIEPPDLILVSNRPLARMVLENLLSNAIKYSPAGTTVSVAAWADPGVIQLVIRDEGPGLSALAEAHLFSKFHQPHHTGTAGETSNGIGLYLVRQYVEMLGGTVRYSRRKPRGAEFSVTLPNERAPGHPRPPW
ncbi:MAG: sensor histidine kinase [Opitutales bacterium]